MTRPLWVFLLLALMTGCATLGLKVDPVTKAYQDLTALQKATSAYQDKVSQVPPDGGGTSFGQALVAQGAISDFPAAPQSIRRTEWPQGVFSYEFYDQNDDMAGGSGMDSVLMLSGVNEDACRKYNEQFTPLGPIVPVYRETGYLRDQRTYCIDYGGNFRYSIVLLHEIK